MDIDIGLIAVELDLGLLAVKEKTQVIAARRVWYFAKQRYHSILTVSDCELHDRRTRGLWQLKADLAIRIISCDSLVFLDHTAFAHVHYE